MSKYQYDKALRESRLAQGLCGKCGKEPPIEGQTLCAACKETQRWQAKKYRMQHKEYTRQKNRNRYQQRLDAGLCVKCGAVPAICNQVYCAKCKEYNAIQNKKHREKARMK